MRYTTLLFDLDQTLFDSDASADAAFSLALDSISMNGEANHYYEVFVDINNELWAMVEAGETTPNEVRNLRFHQLVEATDLDADPIEMADRYTDGLGSSGELYLGAIDVLADLSQVASLAIITNGIGEVQRSRIERLDLDRYFDAVVISGEVGAAKPGAEIFAMTFDELGNPPKDSALMIGDNLNSDIRGGINYGIDTCWYNPDGRTASELPIAHEISDLAGLKSIITG
jgi:2-haloacid dehalogenase